MRKNILIPAFLTLLFLFSACGTTRTLPAPESAYSSAPSSAAVSSAAPRDTSSAESKPDTETPSSSGVSSGEASSRAVSSAQSLASKIQASSSAYVTLNSSAPPTGAPKQTAAAKPMPAVTAKMPEAPGKAVFSQQGAAVDYSNASEGYIMVKYGGSAKIKVLLYFNGGSSYYQYNLAGNNTYIALPLQSGSGSYRIRFMENISGSSYAELCSTQFSAAPGGFGYTLYPNQYVSYTRSSAAVAKAKSLCASAADNSQKVAAIYGFITKTIKYDTAKASSVQAGYLPNVDSTLASKKGICFDYAALMAAMCRSQGIPTRLVIGNASAAGYHSWNEVYLGGWKRYDATFAAAGQSAGTYTAEKYY